MAKAETPAIILRGKSKRRMPSRKHNGRTYRPHVKVWLPDNPNEKFDHPHVAIYWRADNTANEDDYGNPCVTVKFQRGWTDDTETTIQILPSRGFLRTVGPWRYSRASATYDGAPRCRTESYAPEIEASLYHGRTALRAVAWTTELLASADERLREEGSWSSEDRAARALRRNGDALLVLIASLQRLGLDVEIYSASLHAMRAQRGRARRVGGPEYYLTV